VEHEPQALPPPVQPPPRHRVTRSRDRIVAGVASGLSDALGVAPVWTRLAFVVLALFGGLGVAVYIAAWLLLPSSPQAAPPRPFRRALGLVVVPLWLLVIANDRGDGPWAPFRTPYLVAGLLIGVALALWKPGSTIAPAPPAPPAVPAEGGSEAVVTSPPTAGGGARRERPAPSPLGRIAFGLALIVAAVGTAVSQGSSTGVKVSFALAALVCAAGLLVGSLYGHGRWLVVPALVFAGVSVLGAATEDLGVHQSWSSSDTSWSPNDRVATPPPTDIDKGAGDTYLQFENVTQPVAGTIRVGRGRVTISAQASVRLEVHARVGLGSISFPNEARDGYRREATYASGPANAPLVRYDVAVGFGEIDVYRYSKDPGPIPPKLPRPAIALPPGAIASDDQGAVVYEDGTFQLPDGTIVLTDGTVVHPDGSRVYGPGARVLRNGVVILRNGTTIDTNGSVQLRNGVVIVPRPPASAAPSSSTTSTPTTVPPTTVPPTTAAPTTVPPTSAP
jgi:phage shock protein PspC (stress-responsive transcriptional regulator)